MTVSLMYHDLAAVEELNTTGFPGPLAARYKLAPAQFEEHLDAIQTAGVAVGLLDAAPQCALTFDDGGISAVDAARALERRGWHGHFFVVTDLLGQPGFLTAEQVLELSARGHAVGSHSRSHPPYINRLPSSAIAEEWSASRQRLAEVLGTPPWLAAVPGGHSSDTVVEAVRAAGYTALLTSDPTTNVRRRGTLAVHGRYAMQSETSARHVGRLVRGDAATRAVARSGWAAKRALRGLLGRSGYETLRRASTRSW